MISVAEVRHHLLYFGIVGRNRVRRVLWRLVSRVPSSTRRRQTCVDLLGPDQVRAEPPSATQPGAWETYALHVTGDLVIEPKYGWIVAGRTLLIERSMPYHSWSTEVPNLLAQPSIVAALGRPARSVDRVISLRIGWDENYYHFFNDVLGRLRLIESLGIPSDVPIVLSQSMANRGYVRECINAGVFGGREVIAQPTRTYLRCCEVYSVEKRGGDRRDYDLFLDRLLPDGPGREDRRILLVRSPRRGRALNNGEEVRLLCEVHGFEAVDTEGWTLADQIALFRNTRHVVGVHGAGLTNIIFRRGGLMSVLEMIPPGPFPLSFNAVQANESDYNSLCRYYSFDYSSLVGTFEGRRYKRAQNFDVDLGELATYLERLSG